MRAKKITGLILALLLMSALLGACSKKGGAAIGMVPEDAAGAIVIQNMGATAGHLGEFFDWLAKQVPILAMFKQTALTKAGMDFTKAEDLAAKGFDPNGSLVVALLELQTKKAAILIPVKDEKAFIAFMNEMRKKQGGAELTKEGDAYVLPDNAGIMVVKKGYAIMAASKEDMDKIGKGKSIAGSPDYKLISKKLGDAGDVFIYMSKKAMESTPAQGAPEMAKIMKGVGSFGAMININSKEISSKSFAIMTDMANVKKILSSTAENKMLESLDGPAPLLARSNMSLPDLWSYVKATTIASSPESKKQLEDGLAQMKTALGLDIEADLISNIVGSPVVAVYGMAGKSKMPDMVIAIAVKDEAKIKEAIGKLSVMAGGKKAPKDLLALGVTMFASPGGTFYVAVSKKMLIATTSPDRMKQILSGAAPAKSIIAAIKHEEAKKLLQDNASNVIYVSVAEIMNATKTSLPKETQMQVDAYAAQAKGLINSNLLATFAVEEEGVSGSFALKFGE